MKVRANNINSDLAPSWINPILSWGHVVRKRQKWIFGPTYQKHILDEAMMAVVFGYNVPLLEKVLKVSLPSEIDDVLSLFSHQIFVETSANGNIIIHN
ncbi:MAG: hypothetical protein OER74_13080 [Desulfobacteraceae bacterium]|nr:hypothetical protein [Desulfobacteraceae bacterium]